MDDDLKLNINSTTVIFIEAGYNVLNKYSRARQAYVPIPPP